MAEQNKCKLNTKNIAYLEIPATVIIILVRTVIWKMIMKENNLFQIQYIIMNSNREK